MAFSSDWKCVRGHRNTKPGSVWLCLDACPDLRWNPPGYIFKLQFFLGRSCIRYLSNVRGSSKCSNGQYRPLQYICSLVFFFFFFFFKDSTFGNNSLLITDSLQQFYVIFSSDWIVKITNYYDFGIPLTELDIGVRSMLRWLCVFLP